MKKKLSIRIERPFRLLDDIWFLVNKNNEDLTKNYEDDSFFEITLDDILGFFNCQKTLYPYSIKNIEGRIIGNELSIYEINTLDGLKHHILTITAI